MKLRGWLELGAILALLVGGWLYVRQREAFARAEALAGQRQAHVAALRVALGSLQTSAEHQIRRAKAREDSLEARSRALEARSGAWEDSARVLYGRLRSAVPEDLQGQLTGLWSACQSALGALQGSCAAKDSVIQSQRGRLALGDSLRKLQAQVIDSTSAAAAFWKREARPGLLEGLVHGVPRVLIAGGVCALLGGAISVEAGAACGVGFAVSVAF